MQPSQRGSSLATAAWVAWGVAAAAVGIFVVRTLHSSLPDLHSVTCNFRAASRAWWADENLYPSGVAGFLYFPQSAILYTPFTWGPPEVGELAWRAVSLVLFVTGLWRLSRVLSAEGFEGDTFTSPGLQSGEVFGIATLVSLPLAISNLRNGQFNLPLAALMLHAVVELRLGRWWMAVLCLCLMTALKPLGLVLVLLAAVLYPRVIGRLAMGLALVAALPLVHRHPGYAIDMYKASFRTLLTASEVKLDHGQDLRGVPAALHIDVPLDLLMAVRESAAPFVLAVAWLAKRRWGEPIGALYTLTAAGVYLTLFNPRCEGLTYVVLCPAIGFLIAAPLSPHRTTWERMALTAIGAAMAVGQVFTGGPNSWVRPCAALALLVLLAHAIARGGNRDRL